MSCSTSDQVGNTFQTLFFPISLRIAKTVSNTSEQHALVCRIYLSNAFCTVDTPTAFVFTAQLVENEARLF